MMSLDPFAQEKLRAVFNGIKHRNVQKLECARIRSGRASWANRDLRTTLGSVRNVFFA